MWFDQSINERFLIQNSFHPHPANIYSNPSTLPPPPSPSNQYPHYSPNDLSYSRTNLSSMRHLQSPSSSLVTICTIIHSHPSSPLFNASSACSRLLTQDESLSIFPHYALLIIASVYQHHPLNPHNHSYTFTITRILISKTPIFILINL